MGKPPTGEPCAGEPHARFGGREGMTLPDPYHRAFIESFELVEIIVYLFRQSIVYLGSIQGIEIAEM